MSTKLINATGLCQRYRSPERRDRRYRVALQDVSLEVHAGQSLALVGANGSGKSTLLRLLAGIETPGSGRVEHLDGPGTVLTRAQSAMRTAVVFQVPGLDRLLTIEENLRLQASLYGATDIEARVQSCAEAAGVTDRLGDRVGTLSGGLARRADLARALISRPQILMLDEPFVGLDAQSRDRFFTVIDQLRREDPQFTLIIATHAIDEIRLADRVLVLDAGRVVAAGEPSGIAAGVFGSCELLAISDLVEAGEDLLLRSWRVGASSITGGSRSKVEDFAIELSRRGAGVEIREPDFATAYRVLLDAESRSSEDPW